MYGICGWLKTSKYRRLAENVKIPSMGERGSKIAQKPSYDIWTFPRVILLSRVQVQINKPETNFVFVYVETGSCARIFWFDFCSSLINWFDTCLAKSFYLWNKQKWIYLTLFKKSNTMSIKPSSRADTVHWRCQILGNIVDKLYIQSQESQTHNHTNKRLHKTNSQPKDIKWSYFFIKTALNLLQNCYNLM